MTNGPRLSHYPCWWWWQASLPTGHLCIDSPISVKSHGGEAVLARFDKQTLISLEPPRALWQVFYTQKKKSGCLTHYGSVCPAYLHQFRNNSSLRSTTSHVYRANPISVFCVGLPNCEQSSLYPWFLLLTLLSRRPLPKLSFLVETDRFVWLQT